MRLYLLQPRDEGHVKGGRWHTWYDKAHGFVVRADSEEDARALASKDCGDEGVVAWIDPKYTTCTELLSDGKREIVLRDYYAA